MPTVRSTVRCLDTCGCATPSSSTRSPTERSSCASSSRICRRRGSAIALNASEVVAALAMAPSYSHMGMQCQESRVNGSELDLQLVGDRANHLGDAVSGLLVRIAATAQVWLHLRLEQLDHVVHDAVQLLGRAP